MKYSYDPPVVIKKLFRSYHWNSGNNKVLFTFDDGPIPETTEVILKILEISRINAVFFCVGNNIYKNPSLAREILSCGHEIGNHTYNHKIVTKLSAAEISREVSDCNRLAEELLGKKIQYFRPPHGRFNLKLNRCLADEGLQNVMWSLLTFDYKNNINIVKFALKKYMKPDSIIVFHDSLKSKDIISDSIKAAIDEVCKNEFEFGVPSECLR